MVGRPPARGAIRHVLLACCASLPKNKMNSVPIGSRSFQLRNKHLFHGGLAADKVNPFKGHAKPVKSSPGTVAGHPKRKARLNPSKMERKFSQMWAMLGGCELRAEVKFHPQRRWRFDFATETKNLVAIEIEGGVWQMGRHQRPQGFINDCTKYNHAILCGYRVFRLTPCMITPEILQHIIKFSNR